MSIGIVYMFEFIEIIQGNRHLFPGITDKMISLIYQRSKEISVVRSGQHIVL